MEVVQGHYKTRWQDMSEPGDFMYTEPKTGQSHPCSLVFVCPCGCGVNGAVNLRPADPEHPSWDWNGNRERPTLTPSIQRNIECRWHGYLTDGTWNPC